MRRGPLLSAGAGSLALAGCLVTEAEVQNTPGVATDAIAGETR